MYQCRLQQGNKNTVAWIPDRGAKEGVSVEIPELGGFWKVLFVGSYMADKQLKEHQRLNRNSLPSIQK